MKDNGVGIKIENQGKIFKLFGSVRDGNNVKGIGLGLVISRMIVKKFQGDIKFNSKEKKGTVFCFKFLLEKMQDDHVESATFFGNQSE